MMNSPLRDPLLRYASLSGAGLPAGEWHMARTATRRQMHRVALPADATTAAPADLVFTVTFGDGAPSVVFEDEAAAAPVGARPSSRKPRRLTLLSY